MSTISHFGRVAGSFQVCLIVLAWTLFGTRAHASSVGEWRYWQAQQGLADSSVTTISRDLTGGLWMVHGEPEPDVITHFDGRDFTFVKAPSVFKQFDSVDGKNGWIVDPHGLHRYLNGKWTSFGGLDISVAYIHQRARVIDTGNLGAVLLFPGKLVRITGSADSSSLRQEPVATPQALSRIGAFITFERDPSGGVWIVAEKGAAHFLYNPEGVLYGWEISPLKDPPVTLLENGIACPSGELFVPGFNRNTQQDVTLRLWRGNWEAVARQSSKDGPLMAWRDGNGDLWMSDGKSFFQKPQAEVLSDWERVDVQNPVLSGRIARILVNPDGSFFVATTRGLALHVNSAWRSFSTVLDSKGRVVDLRQMLSSVIEDRRRRLWFLAPKALFRFSGGQWDAYPFPDNYQVDSNDPSALGELEDGRILIHLGGPARLAAFDPETHTFSALPLPPDYWPAIFSKRTDGRFDVAIVAAEGHEDALAILDGNSIVDAKPINAKWNLIYARGMYRDSAGALWMGGTGGLFRLANGKYERIPPPGSGQALDPLSAYTFLPKDGGEFLVGGRKAIYRWNGRGLEALSDLIETPRKLIRDRFGTVWAASGSGVFRGFRGQTARRGSTEHDWFVNDESDGLPSSLVQSLLEDSQGRVWAATSKGPAVFRPNTDNDPPRAVISDKLNSSEAPSSGQIQIVFSGQDKWSLTPVALLRFSYRLDGGPWSPFSDNRIATFRGTPVGKHEFEVIALDRSGNIDPSSARFAFTVLTPWYFTFGFLEIVSLSVVVIVYLVWLVVRHVAQLKKLATRDGLTAEWNRRAIFQLLASELEQAKRKSGSVAVIMIDVDEFKRINDKYGHPVGDLVLSEVARRLRSGTRASDQLGRYGGEEFLIILPNCSQSDAIARAETLRRAVERQSISAGAQQIDITCSFGVTGTKQGSYDLQQLLREADAALYEAKQSGRNRVGAAPDPVLANAALGG